MSKQLKKEETPKTAIAKVEGNPTPVEQRRMALLEAMSVPLQVEAKKVEELLKREAKGVLRNRWKVGEIVNRVAADRGTYNADGVEKICAWCGVPNPQTLWECARLQKAFPDEAKLAEIALSPMQGGGQLTYSHFLVLMELKTAADRNKLIERTLNEGLSAAQLHTIVKTEHARTVETRRRGAGRMPSSPTSPLAAAQAVVSYCNGLHNRYGVWVPVLCDEVAEMEPEKLLDPRLETGMLAVQSRAVEARDDLDNLLDKVDKNLVRIERVKAKHKEVASKDKREQTAADKKAAKAK